MSAKKMVRSRNSPRRKAGRNAPRKTKRKIVFRLVVEAQEMIVECKPERFGDSGMVQFTFRSPHKPARRILISETGYYGYYASKEEVDEAGGPESFAREFVCYLLARSRRALTGDAKKQLVMFE